MREWLVVVALCACDKHDDRPKLVAPQAELMGEHAKGVEVRKKLARLTTTLPAGWTSEYDAGIDIWVYTGPKLADGRTTGAHLDRADESTVASPDAYLRPKIDHYWDKGTTATIESRESLKDGFAMTVVVKPAVDPTHPKRETYVVRQIGTDWIRCECEWVPDDASRDQVLALCKSVTAPK